MSTRSNGLIDWTANVSDPAQSPLPMFALFQTNRLRCRRWTSADFDAVYAIYSDPVAMQWVGEGKPIAREACEKWFAVTEANYQTRGYGMFALDDLATGLMVGCCGLIHPGGQPEAEIKYAFLRSTGERAWRARLFRHFLGTDTKNTA
jgi:RimJ/RimL family protein N-acetyltransferase